MNCRDSISPISFPPSKAVVIRRFISAVVFLRTAEEQPPFSDFGGAEGVILLSDIFVKSSPPLSMSLGYIHIIHIFICNANYIFLYV